MELNYSRNKANTSSVFCYAKSTFSRWRRLGGAENSAALRDKLCDAFGLPHGMSANALLEALNIITDYDGYKAAVKEIQNSEFRIQN